MGQVLDEVKLLTGNKVAQKQDAAKLNFPKIVEKIKASAALGNSDCKISVDEMNEYDKKLLEEEGFRVCLCDNEKDKDYWRQTQGLGQYIPNNDKIWVVTW